MRRLGLVHTVSVLARTFEDLITDQDRTAQVVHVADPWLLATARTRGVDSAVRERVARHAVHLASVGADAVLITCSSIAETAERAGEAAGVPVLRVDRSMAQDAVCQARQAARGRADGGRIAVLATLESTLGPTGRLVASIAKDADPPLLVTSGLIPGAARARSSGDEPGHDRAICEAVLRSADEADVIVLAQASMAAALGEEWAAVPVLTSPVGGVRDLLRAAALA